MQNENYILKDGSEVTVRFPKIYMKGSKVHFEGIAGYSDQLVIEYNTLINALGIMRAEQREIARKNGRN